MERENSRKQGVIVALNPGLNISQILKNADVVDTFKYGKITYVGMQGRERYLMLYAIHSTITVYQFR